MLTLLSWISRYMYKRQSAGAANRYYRGTNTDERVEGSGLGMSIAMQIAGVHNGEIIVDSEINKGTLVTLMTIRIQAKPI